ncbi:hypothetical protein [Aureispira sp. CCB-E]|uniref:hypothetical protein n=1 Tax=Aureispira sp. CCB-E TaxID=3051121 RepID=UPI0028691858|nr:hypothetical protein [Aureispira sp. CCB-E]WMX15746.1 hypothetical protein QP953_05035 [Aureispira sp. CCB-E]
MTEFDKLFRDNLKEGKAETPSFVWDNIEKEIEEKKRKKGLFFFFQMLSILLLLLSLGFIYWVIDDLPQQASFEEIVSEPNLNSKESNAIPKSTGFDELPTTIYSKKNQNKIDKQYVNKKEAYISENLPTDIATVEDLSKGLLSLEGKEGRGIERLSEGLLLSEGKEDKGVEDLSKGLLLPEEKEENAEGAERIVKELLLEDECIDSMFIENKDLAMLLTGEVVKENDSRKNKPRKTPFFIETKVGYSSYKMSLWNSSFVFGDLSNRKFKSSGLNANISFGYQINSLLNPIVGFNYNRKQAEFNYSALYDDEGYFTYNIQGNKMPLDEINDSDLLCNQFILYDIKAVFNITSFSLTVGNRFNLLQLNKIGIDLDVSYSLEISSNIDVQSIDKIDVSEHLRERFNSKIAMGLNINYQLSQQLRLFVQAEYIFKPYNSNNFHRSNAHELINSLGLRFNF